MDLDLIVRDATLPDGRRGLDIAVSGGRIVGIEPGIRPRPGRRSTAAGLLVSPPFVIAISTWTRRSPSGCRA